MLVSVLGAHVQARAYRPFDGTDAAVVAPGEFELEVGASKERSGTTRIVSMPAVVANIGLAGGNEVVLEGRWLRSSVPGQPPDHVLGDTALSLKHVWRKGVLQDADGLSVATECGVLLPELRGESGAGWSCAGIASGSIQPLTIHLNVVVSRTRHDTRARSLGLIAEGPQFRGVRPVAEALVNRDSDGQRERSMLVGAIYRRSDALSFDAGVRSGREREARIREVRVGFTWSR